ncbi:protein of unknown function [Pelagirhabdus alkalitolerans]|uniref:DUF1798 family protein n=1 Tax=Pelagirhabdus alkalitolerans TaxID=1612202 RepID=A0A1G6H9Z5_9BACI|nr:DUF1798 family protein [Pelagirhabdus alkalitolerans]SDB90964.1 protein of unknown function [Pelagirhabdus alkalitolerans]
MLIEKNHQIRIMLEKLRKQYLESDPPEDIKNIDFFNQVKEETNPMFELAKEWSDIADEQVKARKINIHPSQVQSTQENIELVILHSYYIDVDRKRYFELHQSIDYVLDMAEK